MAENDDWKKAAFEAWTSVSSSVVSSTATGHPELARAGTNVAIYINQHFYNMPGSVSFNQGNLEKFQITNEAFEQAAVAAGVPKAEIEKLRESRDNDLQQATTLEQKILVWNEWASKLGEIINKWAAILKPFLGGGDG